MRPKEEEEVIKVTYCCGSLSLAGRLQPTKERDSITRLPLQFPVAD